MPLFGVEETLEAVRGLAGAGNWVVTSARSEGATLVLLMSIAGDHRTFGLVLPAPWTDSAQWWLYLPPEDAQDWAVMLKHWIEENIDRGAAGWATLHERDGVHYFVAEPYGFRPQDEAEHRRALSLGGPDGWNADTWKEIQRRTAMREK
jgi:hypothetical protein